ncbi:MAG: uracil-DNA glycosylase family protein [Deltaproteobacteria bacterium]
MASGNRDQNIRQVIEMEDRIAHCRRCDSLLQCVRRPSMGKGELDPDVLMVFECESTFTRELANLVELRNLIKSQFRVDNVYHNYVVRCQPKACAIRNNISCFGDAGCLDRDNNCLLSGKPCEGIPVKPSNDEILACLPFLLEEIEIFRPRYIILFGERAAFFTLRSFGMFDNVNVGEKHVLSGMNFLIATAEDEFDSNQCQELIEGTF